MKRMSSSRDPAELTVTVARLQAFPFVFSVPAPDVTAGAMWEQLPKVTLQVSTDDQLVDVLRRACQALGVGVADPAKQAGGDPRRDAADRLVYAAFRRSDDDVMDVDEHGYRYLRRERREYVNVAVVPDAYGRALWRRPIFDATLGELLDAHEAGLLDGDPREPYLVLSVPQGEFGLLASLVDWPSILVALKILYDVLQVAGTVEGGLGLRDRLRAFRRRRTPEMLEIVERRASDWASRGAAPGDLLELLASHAWRPDALAALLGTSESEAEAILWGFGFAYDDTAAVWRHKADPLAEVIAEDVELAFWDVATEGQRDLQDTVAQRTKQFLEGDHVPSLQEIEAQITEEWLREEASELTGDEW